MEGETERGRERERDKVWTVTMYFFCNPRICPHACNKIFFLIVFLCVCEILELAKNDLTLQSAKSKASLYVTVTMLLV